MHIFIFYNNDFINNNGELGLELKSYFVEADQNGLKFEELGIEAAHKYGEYQKFYGTYIHFVLQTKTTCQRLLSLHLYPE